MPRTPILRAFLACIVLGLSGAAAQDADAYALLVQRGNSALDRFDLESAEARFTEAIAAAESAGIGVHDIVEVERRLARVQGLRGATPAAVVTLRRALERWEKAFGTTDAGLVACLEDLAAQLRTQGEAQAALEALRRALSLVKDDPEGAQPAPGADADSVRLRLLDAYVKIAIALPDPNAVLDGAQKRLAILARMRGADSPDLTLPLKQIAQALRTLGRDKDAIPNIEMWIGIQEKVRGVDHPSIAEGLEDLVACQYAIGALDDADATITRWTRILKGVAGDHPNLVDTGEWSARVLARRGMHKEAADRLESTFTLAQRAFWNRTQRLGAIALALARESRECGRLERAEQCLQAARGYYATLGDASPEALQVEAESARLDLALGKPAEAATAMEATIARLEARFGKENRVLVEPLEILARAYLALDRTADAESVAQRAASLVGGR